MSESVFSSQLDTVQILSEHGIRPLSHRVAVYQYLNTHLTHPTAETIFLDLKSKLASLSRTTVYNVLNLLCEKGVVRRVSIEDHELRYDVNTSDHIHLKCGKCGQVFDLPKVEFPRIQLPEGFVQKEVQVNIIGLCHDCVKNNLVSKQ
ncbi:MAG: Fur family transcriptional regulator [Sphaerochaetaceae bacterium]|jgi:Fe2+ or Zn2+ uptake regulation protein